MFVEIIYEEAEGHRVLLFSQWTRLLDLLEVLLNDIDIDFLRLDGSTPVKVNFQKDNFKKIISKR